MNKVDLLHEWVKLNSGMLFKLKDRTDDQYRRSENHKELIASLMKLTELDSEILKAVEQQIN